MNNAVTILYSSLQVLMILKTLEGIEGRMQRVEKGLGKILKMREGKELGLGLVIIFMCVCV